MDYHRLHPPSRSRHVSGELMRAPAIGLISPDWLGSTCTLMAGFLMAADEAQLLISAVNLGRQCLKRRNDFQVLYLRDPHDSINLLPISFVIRPTRRRSAAPRSADVSSSSFLALSRRIRRTFLADPEAPAASMWRSSGELVFSALISRSQLMMSSHQKHLHFPFFYFVLCFISETFRGEECLTFKLEK